ncbi:MAG TPA: hypothetical protein VGE45_00385 [Chloroflexia bacterium]|jgi:hypothetical protein
MAGDVEFRYIPIGKLKELLAAYEDTDMVWPNDVHNLTIFRPDPDCEDGLRMIAAINVRSEEVEWEPDEEESGEEKKPPIANADNRLTCVRCLKPYPVATEPSGWSMRFIRPISVLPEHLLNKLEHSMGVIDPASYLCGDCYFDLMEE